MLSNFYRGLFSNTILSRDKQAVGEVKTTRNSTRLSTSVGGTITGRGADLIIIDYPLKPEEAFSETRRKAVNEWFDHTRHSRLNDKQNGVMIVIMQRLHEDDLTGYPPSCIRFVDL